MTEGSEGVELRKAVPSADSGSARSAGLVSWLLAHAPPGQFLRYLAVGVWNTTFAYVTFALATAFLDELMPAAYLMGSLISSLLNITVSFLGYKWFVFKTRGNYFREWVQAVMVYSGSILLGLAILPPTVWVVTLATNAPERAPYLAGAIILGVQVVLNFLAHRRFTFREKRQ